MLRIVGYFARLGFTVSLVLLNVGAVLLACHGDGMEEHRTAAAKEVVAGALLLLLIACAALLV